MIRIFFTCYITTARDGITELTLRRAQKGNLQFYLLISLLYREASLLPTEIKMVSEGKLRRYQRKNSNAIQGKLFRLWSDYETGTVSVNGLLKKCGGIYGPGA